MNKRNYLKFLLGSTIGYGFMNLNPISQPTLATSLDLPKSISIKDTSLNKNVSIRLKFNRFIINPENIDINKNINFTIKAATNQNSFSTVYSSDQLRLSKLDDINTIKDIHNFDDVDNQDLIQSNSVEIPNDLNIGDEFDIRIKIELECDGAYQEIEKTIPVYIIEDEYKTPTGIITDFENTDIGSLPENWSSTIHGSNGGPSVNDTRASSKNKSLINYDPNTGSPSHSHVYTDSYSPQGNHSITLDYYVDGNKNNGGTADGFEFSNISDPVGSNNHSYNETYSINCVNNGSYITVADGVEGSINLEPAKYNQWVKLYIEVDYEKNQYFVEIDDYRYGPFNFVDEGSAADYPIFHHRTDNYTGWIDNIR